MPRPAAAQDHLRMTRRAAVATLAAAALAGCTGGRDEDPEGRPPGSRAAEVDPDVSRAAAAVADLQVALDLALAITRRHPGLGPVRAAVAAHEQHIAVLAGAAPSPTAGPSPTDGGSSPTPPRVPAAPRRAMHALARAEQSLAAAMTRHAAGARSGVFARVLGSTAASAAQHATALAEAGGPPPRGAGS